MSLIMHAISTILSSQDFVCQVSSALSEQVVIICMIDVALSQQVLEFRIRKEMTLEMWTERQEKIQTFFGPGVQADIQKTNEVHAHHPAVQVPVPQE